MSHHKGKPTNCIGENKDADQLRGNREADQRLCFRYSDSAIPLLLKSEISSFLLFSVTVQVDLCRTWSETTLLVFPRGGSYQTSIIINWTLCFRDKTIILMFVIQICFSVMRSKQLWSRKLCDISGSVSGRGFAPSPLCPLLRHR